MYSYLRRMFLKVCSSSVWCANISYANEIINNNEKWGKLWRLWWRLRHQSIVSPRLIIMYLDKRCIRAGIPSEMRTRRRLYSIATSPVFTLFTHKIRVMEQAKFKPQDVYVEFTQTVWIVEKVSLIGVDNNSHAACHKIILFQTVLFKHCFYLFQKRKSVRYPSSTEDLVVV